MTAPKVFQSLQIFYHTLGLYSPKSNRVHSSTPRTLFFSIFSLLFFCSLLAYLLLEAKTIQEVGVSFYGAVSIGDCVFGLFETIRKISQILTLIKHVEVFIEKRSCNAHSVAIHSKLVDKIERTSRLIDFLLVKLWTIVSVSTPSLVVFINYFILGMGNESFLFDQTIWLPFDSNTPIGLFVALLFESGSIYVTLCGLAPVFCLFIGSCWVIISFLRDIARDISHLRRKKISHLNQRDLTERFRDFVRFHADIEELVGEFNGIYEWIILVIFLYGLSTVASSLIVFQSSLGSSDPIELFSPLCLMMYSFVLIFYPCEMGQMVNNQFDRLSDDIWRCDWYLLPNKLQQMLVIIIENVQPVSIRGFANTECTRDSFKRTIHTGFSYFMMLHQME